MTRSLELTALGRRVVTLLLGAILLVPTANFFVTLLPIFLGTVGFGESCDPACTAP